MIKIKVFLILIIITTLFSCKTKKNSQAVKIQLYDKLQNSDSVKVIIYNMLDYSENILLSESIKWKYQYIATCAYTHFIWMLIHMGSRQTNFLLSSFK